MNVFIEVVLLTGWPGRLVRCSGNGAEKHVKKQKGVTFLMRLPLTALHKF